MLRCAKPGANVVANRGFPGLAGSRSSSRHFVVGLAMLHCPIRRGFPEGAEMARRRDRSQPQEHQLTPVNLPAALERTGPTLNDITLALGVPRSVLASDPQIGQVWSQLPRLVASFPREHRNELHARMCVAICVGLFDSAINYAWNSAILRLRDIVRAFGLGVVAQIKQADFDDDDLIDLKDADLLRLCLDLDLVSEEAYFFLDQCRDTRNRFSAAHPSIGQLDADEVVAFLSRCARYALTDAENPRGVDAQALIAAVKGKRFHDDQLSEWADRLNGTHQYQRSTLFSTLHGIYCDPASGEEARNNAIELCEALLEHLGPEAKSSVINRHSDYVAIGDEPRQKASRSFFEKLGLLDLLTEAERHSIVSQACKKLVSVHDGWDNFYNEPPFAERLAEIAAQIAIPESAQEEYVMAVCLCGAGNPHGISVAALPHYQEMIRGFSPVEIAVMLDLPKRKGRLSERIKNHSACKKRFGGLVMLLNSESIPRKLRAVFESWQ